MHNYLINAALQIIPIVEDKHPYQWVDEAIEVIVASGLKYEVQAFSTVVEGSYEQVIQLIHEINEYLLQKGCAEWICNAQVQIRGSGDITAEEKTGKYRN